MKPRLGVYPEDFVVEEIPLRDPEGYGPHTHLWIEKRLANTFEIARLLARKCRVHAREVGFSGLKDRNAVTRQWFSVPRVNPETASLWEDSHFRVLRASRDPEKIRTGRIAGNRFSLVVRDIPYKILEQLQTRLDLMEARGMPNRFGKQRFGRRGDNSRLGREILFGKRRSRSRQQERFLVSALQSEVFNKVLDARGECDRLEPGDWAMDHLSGRVKLVDVFDVWRDPHRRLEVSATGPIFGCKVRLAQEYPGELERRIFLENGIPEPADLKEPRGLRIPGSRRPLRVKAAPIAVNQIEANVVSLSFSLPSGSYATILVDELFGEISR
ncbi:tRNA pseudouridine(13) synthase TruD [Myxococcota bacterium]|nr:tRNA pseudouridine(13) synthase TruD [Myxococcota bacterium]